MRPLSRPRRALCAIAALVIAGISFRSQLAAALVTSGDSALQAGDSDRAIRTYERALAIDPLTEIAADRLAFFLALRHDAVSARRAVVVATASLQHRSNSALFADRAFAEMQLHHWRDAERDFGRAGALARDARYDHLAGRMALKAGDRAAARRFAEEAIAADPAFSPARVLRAHLE